MPRIQRGGFWLERLANSPNLYICWYDAVTQRTKRKSVGSADQGRAEIELAEHVLRHTELSNADPEVVQLALVLNQWHDEHGSKIASAEANKYGIATLMERLGAAFVSDLTPNRIAKFITDMREAEYSESYINRHLTLLRAALRHAYKNGRLRSHPFVRSIREEPKQKHIFTPQQFAEFIDRSRSTEHLFRFCMISANTLARPDAVKMLSPFQVDFDGGVIHLNPHSRSQTKKFRPMIPITNTLRPWLRTWDGSPYVSYHGKPVADIGNSFARVGADMGLEVSPYCIRHTMATELAKANIQEGHIARFLGHIPPGTKRATEFYIHFRPDFLRDAVGAIDAYFERLPLKLATPAKLRVVK
jgi:integrase